MLLRFPYTEVVEADLFTVPPEHAEFDAGFLRAEILARRPQRLPALDVRNRTAELAVEFVASLFGASTLAR